MFGCIVAFHGAIVDIPSGWGLCDGTQGTPNLEDSFVIGAGGAYAPGVTGGTTDHTHTGTTDGHTHVTEAGPPNILDEVPNDAKLTTEVDTFTTTGSDHEPPYYALAFIMHL